MQLATGTQSMRYNFFGRFTNYRIAVFEYPCEQNSLQGFILTRFIASNTKLF